MIPDSPDSISAQVEGDNLVYEWHGDDAEARHEAWALDDAQTYDEVGPA
ncbi:MAG: hypothetical protein J0J04_07585 [Microbacterium sp.]|nr:hypothetical protein [Microbacterium sp.]MBN9214659.1 hypothetical protein [Microbacterium sp.]